MKVLLNDQWYSVAVFSPCMTLMMFKVVTSLEDSQLELKKRQEWGILRMERLKVKMKSMKIL